MAMLNNQMVYYVISSINPSQASYVRGTLQLFWGLTLFNLPLNLNPMVMLSTSALPWFLRLTWVQG